MTRLVDLDQLSARDLDELGALLREEAQRRRRRLTVDQAWAAWFAVELSERGARSPCAEILRVRAAARRLVTVDGWHPEQIVDAMLEVAETVCWDRGIAVLAVAKGIADAGEESC